LNKYFNSFDLQYYIFFKEYKFKLNLIGFTAQLLPFLLLFIFIPMEYLFNEIFWPILFVVFVLTRFPHEYLHKYGGYIIGVKCKCDFLKVNATCTPLAPILWFQVVIIAATPLIVLGILFLSTMFIFYILNLSLWFYIGLASFLLLIISCEGDIGYIFYALRYKTGYVFVDEGIMLKVYKHNI